MAGGTLTAEDVLELRPRLKSLATIDRMTSVLSHAESEEAVADKLRYALLCCGGSTVNMLRRLHLRIAALTLLYTDHSAGVWGPVCKSCVRPRTCTIVGACLSPLG
jgi:hypothetical protein